MKDSMIKLKRMMAFLLCMLLLATTVGDDFFALADENIGVEEGAPESEPAAAPASESAGDTYTAPAEEENPGDAGIPADASAQTDPANPEAAASGDPANPDDPNQVDPSNPADPAQPEDGVPADENGSDANTKPENQVAQAAGQIPVDTGYTEPTDPANQDPANSAPSDPEQVGDDNTPKYDENGNPIVETPENIDIPEETSTEETPDDETPTDNENDHQTCEHTWGEWTSNNDGTHSRTCSECGESETVNCTYDENGVCTVCGHKKDDEHKHSYEYSSNNDGTHVKRCTDCGEETTEECTYDENGICIYCGYEGDEGYVLVETNYSTTIDGVVINVYGWIPAGATIDIKQVSISQAESVVESAGKDDFEVFKAFDIQIYTSSGDIYQPETDGRSVEITVKGVSEISEVDDSEVTVLREEHDGSVEELNTSVSGENVTFNSEHFSIIIIGVDPSATSQGTITINAGEYIATAEQADKYVNVKSAYVKVQMDEEQSIDFIAEVYKDNPGLGKVNKGTAVSTVKKTYTADKEGTHQINFTFDSTGNTWIAPGTNYSIVITVNDGTANVEYGYNTSPIYTSDSTDSQQVQGAVIVTADESTAPDDITAITIGNSNTDRKIYSSTGSAATYTGEVFYMVGDKDTLTVQLSPAYTRAITWTLSSVSGSTSAVIRASGENANGMVYNLTASAAGVMKLEAKYSDSIKATLTITVLQPYFGDNTSTTTFSEEYKGAAWTPTVGLYNGTNTVSVGTLSYADNTNAGTAKVTVPYTSGNNQTTNFVVPFTITKKALTWSANFSPITKDAWTAAINTSTNTVTSDPGATSEITGVTLAKDTDYTITLSDKNYTSEGITYTATIGEGTSGNYSVSNVSGTITVSTANDDINNYVEVHWLNDDEPRYQFTGSAIEPIADLTWGTDFIFYLKDTTTVASFVTADKTTVTYENNVNVGVSTAKIYFEVTGYKEKLSLTFSIYAQNFSEKLNIAIANEDGSEVTSGNAKYTHTGSSITPDSYVVSGTTYDRITIKLGDTTLVKGTDYTVAYTNNKNIGTATVTITGKGNYTGTQDAYFTIQASFALDATIYVGGSTKYANASNNWASGYSKNYTGNAVKPSAYVELNGATLNKDLYTLTYADTINSDNTLATAISADAGTKYVVVTYNGVSLAASYTVKPIDISTNSAAIVNVINKTKTYTGSAIELTASTDYTLKYTSTEKENVLAKDTDYTLTYSDNTNVGTVTMTFTGTGKNYTGTKTATFTIEAATLTDSMIELEYQKHPYTGELLTPTVRVVFNGKDLGTTTSSVENFSVSYDSNRAIGTAKVTVTGKNNLTGSVVKTFEITSKSLDGLTITINGKSVQKDSENNDFFKDDSIVYIGKTVSVKVIITDGSYTLVKGADSDYTVAITNGISIDDESKYAKKDGIKYTSAVVITGKNNYAGTTKTIYFNINPRPIDADTVVKTITNAEWAAGATTAFSPTVSLVDNGRDLKTSLQGQALTVDTDYTVTADSKATSAGEGYTVKITGKGNYTGDVEEKYSVGHNITEATFKLVNPCDTSATPAEYSRDTATARYLVDYIGNNEPKEALTITEGTVTKGLAAGTDYTKSAATSTTGKTDTYNSYGGTNIIEVTLTGTNGYYGTLTYNYQINPLDFSTDLKTSTNVNGRITAEDKAGTSYLPFTGDTIPIAERLILTYTNGSFSEKLNYDGSNYVANKDYILDKTEIGQDKGAYTITFTGAGGNYINSNRYGYNIDQGKLEEIKITADDVNVFKDDTTNTYYVYYNSGNEITLPSATVEVTNSAGKTLTLNTDYELQYSSNRNVGTAYIKAIGKGNYSSADADSKIASFEIRAVVVDDNTFDVTLNEEDSFFYYNATKKEPRVTVKLKKDGTTLTEGTDYEISYPTDTDKNIYPGTEAGKTNYVTVTGKGIYNGSVTKYFAISLNLADTSYVTATANKTSYNVGDTPVVTVSYKDVNDAAGTYSKTLSADNYTASLSTTIPGNGVIEITGKNVAVGNYPDIPITLKADIKDYVTLTKSEYAYTGETISVDEYLVIPYGTKSTDGITGDYTVTYNTGYGDRINVGMYYVTITPLSNSSYYIAGKSITLPYYVKYDLDKLTLGSTLTVTSKDSTDRPITFDSVNSCYKANYNKKVGTSGLSYFVRCKFGTSDSEGVLTSDTPNGDTYLKVTDTGLKAVTPEGHPQYITVSVGNANYVMGGPRNIPVVIDGINIGTYYGEIQLEDGTTWAQTGNFQYTGKEIKPAVRVRATSSTPLTEVLSSSDYSVSYHANADVSTAESAYVIITGNESAGYTGTLKLVYTIKPRNLSECTVEVDKAYYVGNAVPVRPKVHISYGSIELVEGTDYEVTYTANTGGATSKSGIQGKYAVTAKGANFTGNIAETGFDILKLDFSKSDLVYLIDKDGNTINESQQMEIDYTRKLQNEYELVRVAVNNPYYIEGTDDASLKNPILDYVNAKDYTITVYDAAGTVKPIQDMNSYTLKVTGNTATNCEETRIVNIKVAPRSIPANYKDNTGEIKVTVTNVDELKDVPTVTITDSGVEGATATEPIQLTVGTDYTVTVTGNDVAAAGEYQKDAQGNYIKDEDGNKIVADGSPYVTITGLTNYGPEPLNIAFSVGKDLGAMKQDGKITYTRSGEYIAEYTYDGVSHRPTLDIKLVDGSKQLVEGTDYTVSVVDASGNEDSISAGVKTLTVTGMGDYFGSFTDTYKINTRKLEGNITWTNKYDYAVSETGAELNNKKITFTLNDDGMKTLTGTEAAAIFKDSKYAGYYYEEYDGKPITPSLVITDAGLADGAASKIISPDDYEITYNHNDAYYDPNTLGDWTYAEVHFKGNYADSTTIIKAYFLIGPNKIEQNDFKVQFVREEELKLRDYQFDYTGEYIAAGEVEIVVSNNSETKLTEGTDYNVYYSDALIDNPTTETLKAAKTPRDPGSAYVYVEGKGSYTGILYREYKIVADMSQTRVVTFESDGKTIKQEGIPDQFQTGTAIMPTFGVVLDRVEKEEGEDAYIILQKDVNYSVEVGETDDYKSYEDLIISAKSAYYKNSTTYRVGIKLDPDLVVITNYEPTYPYTGKPIEPDFKTDYDNIDVVGVTYYRDGVLTTDTTNVGVIVAKVEWVATSGDTGVADAQYEIIQRSLGDCTVIIGKSQRYTGNALKPNFTVYLKTTNIAGKSQVYTLVPDTDYSTVYSTNTTGTGVIALTGNGNFKDQKFPTYDINLWPVVNLSVSATTQNSITVNWERDMYSDGTELTLQKMNSNGEYVTVDGPIKVAGKTTTYTFSGLDSSSKYQVRARAYTDNGVYTANEKAAYVESATGLSTSAVSGSSPSSGKATITWNDSGDVTMYYIYRDTNTNDKSDDTLVAVIPASTGEFTNVNLPAGTYYYYIFGYYLSNGTLVEVNQSDYVEITVN